MLDRIRTDAAAVLKPWLRPFEAPELGGINVDLGAGLESFGPLPDDAPESARLALQVLGRVHALKLALEALERLHRQMLDSAQGS